jgi:hypothetical protein
LSITVNKAQQRLPRTITQQVQQLSHPSIPYLLGSTIPFIAKV